MKRNALGQPAGETDDGLEREVCGWVCGRAL
jgi:hypothetical protein